MKRKHVLVVLPIALVVVALLFMIFQKPQHEIDDYTLTRSNDGKTVYLSNIILRGSASERSWKKDNANKLVGRAEYYQIVNCKEFREDRTFSVTYDDSSILTLAMYDIRYFISDGKLYIFCGVENGSNVPQEDILIKQIEINV